MSASVFLPHTDGCFIQKKYRRIAQDGARDAAAGFAGAEKDAPLADLRVVTGRKPLMKSSHLAASRRQ